MSRKSVDPVLSARSRIGGLVRLGGTPEQIEDARRELAEAQLQRAITKALTGAPPLTDEQRARLAARLSPYAGGDAR